MAIDAAIIFVEHFRQFCSPFRPRQCVPSRSASHDPLEISHARWAISAKLRFCTDEPERFPLPRINTHRWFDIPLCLLLVGIGVAARVIRSLDRRTSDLMAHRERRYNAGDKKWSCALRKSRSFTRSKRNALRCTYACVREVASLHSLSHPSVRGRNSEFPIRSSGLNAFNRAISLKRTRLELEPWPVSRKKTAPHRSLAVIVVDVMEVRRIRESAVLVTGAP